jgi:hypothetical protein
MTGVEIDRLGWMCVQLARRSFRDWTLSMVSGDENQAHMVIVYTEADSYTGERREFKVIARIDLTDDGDQFHDQVTRALRQAWDHEFDEHNQLDGKPINDPHADIERWHCVCGCLGPKQADHPHWTCTKCGMVQHAAPVKAETNPAEETQ